MDDIWRPRCNPPIGLVVPVAVDPAGSAGPTRGQARGPRWRRTTPGFYVPVTDQPTTVEQRILEQSMRLPAGGVVTGWAALRLAGGGFFDGVADDGVTSLPVPLLLPPRTDIRRGTGFVVRRQRSAPGESVVLHGIPCASPLRAVLDEVRRHDLRSAVVALDMALAAGLFTVAALDRFLQDRRGVAGCRALRDAREHIDGASRSPQESRLRLIWTLDARLPRPVCNPLIGDLSGRTIGQPDLLSPELGVVGEFDGRFHRGRERHRRDVERWDRFRECGLEPFAVVGADLRDIDLVVGRMRRAVERARSSGLAQAWTVRRR